MRFDRYTIVFLLLRDDAPALNDEESEVLQDAHLDHLARLHESGDMLVAGPLIGEENERMRGICIFHGEPDVVRVLCEADPAVRIGRFEALILPWMAPAGAMTFSPTRFPHSMADVRGD